REARRLSGRRGLAADRPAVAPRRAAAHQCADARTRERRRAGLVGPTGPPRTAPALTGAAAHTENRTRSDNRAAPPDARGSDEFDRFPAGIRRARKRHEPDSRAARRG